MSSIHSPTSLPETFSASLSPVVKRPTILGQRGRTPSATSTGSIQTSSTRDMTVGFLDSGRNSVVSSDDGGFKRSRNNSGSSLASFSGAKSSTGDTCSRSPLVNPVPDAASRLFKFKMRPLDSAAIVSDDESEIEMRSPKHGAKIVSRSTSAGEIKELALHSPVHFDCFPPFSIGSSSELHSPDRATAGPKLQQHGYGNRYALKTGGAPPEPTPSLAEMPSPFSLEHPSLYSEDRQDHCKAAKTSKHNLSHSIYFKKRYSKDLQLEMLHTLNGSNTSDMDTKYQDVKETTEADSATDTDLDCFKKLLVIATLRLQLQMISKFNRRWNKSPCTLPEIQDGTAPDNRSTRKRTRTD